MTGKRRVQKDGTQGGASHPQNQNSGKRPCLQKLFSQILRSEAMSLAQQLGLAEARDICQGNVCCEWLQPFRGPDDEGWRLGDMVQPLSSMQCDL